MNELLQKIESFDIDGGPCASTFAMRLAKEQQWTAGYTARVIREYKRFLYLGATQGPVTPSEVVDEAWHLHMIYTESYWTRLCGEVLGKPFHHRPGRGGSAEARKHRDQFQDTRSKYLAVFGEEPPADIWSVKLTKPGYNPETHWLIDRRQAGRWMMIGGGMAAAGVVAAGCTEEGVPMGVGLVICLAPIVIIAFVGTMIGRAMQNRDKRNLHGGGGGMSGYGGFAGCTTHSTHFMDTNHAPGGHHSGHSNDGESAGHAGHDTDAGVGSHGDAWGGDSSSDSGSSDSGSSDSGSSCGSSCGGGGD